VVVAHYAGITVAQMNESSHEDARSRRYRQGREEPSRQDRSSRHRRRIHQGLFTGQTLIAYAEDPVVAPKITSAFAKENDKLVILGGAMGATALDIDGVKTLATLPVARRTARQAARPDLQAPATRIAQVSTRRLRSLPACSGLCRQGRGGMRPVLGHTLTSFEPLTEGIHQWLISPSS
jgi:large subunit ribosomal protein L10